MIFEGKIKRKDVLKYLDKELERLHNLLQFKHLGTASMSDLWNQIKILQKTLNQISLRSAGLEY